MAKRTFASRTLGKAYTFQPATLAGVSAAVAAVVVGHVAELDVYTAGVTADTYQGGQRQVYSYQSGPVQIDGGNYELR